MTDPAADLQKDPLLQSAPSCEGFKVLEPAVLYARIGAGGMGAVYRGRHFSLECDVAVKVLKPDLAHDEQFVARFAREARLAARISNDNVVRVLDVKEKNGIHYLVMEFVQGETARERVKRKGPLAEAEALAIVLGAALGLREAHAQGIVHRDIKPDNVLVSAEGAIKLADLGLAKQKQTPGEQNLTVLASGVMGTPQYMPPEQWRTPDVTPAADVWALGATLYYLLAGKSGIPAAEMLVVAEHIRDHDFPNVAAVRPDVRPEVAALLAKCTARKPEQRFADARELVKALRPLVTTDDDLLRDPEAGLGNSNVAMVTPPPRATLARIKLQVAQDPDDVATRPAGAPGTAPKASPEPAGAAQPAGGEPAAATVVRPAPARRSGLWAVVVVLVLAGVAGGGYAAGWFQPATKTSGPEVAVVPPAKDQDKPNPPAVAGDQAPPTVANDTPERQPAAQPAAQPAGQPDQAAPATAVAGSGSGQVPTVPSTDQPAGQVPPPGTLQAATPATAPSSGSAELGKPTPATPPPTATATTDEPPPTPPPAAVVDPQQAAKAELARGLVALPRAAGLDTAIGAFEQALRLDGSLVEAKQNLVVALVAKSKQLVGSDPDAAFDAAGRARELAADDAAVATALAQATTALQQRLAASVTLRSPKPGAVFDQPTVVVDGAVAGGRVRQVRLVVVPGRAAATPFPREQAVVAAVVGGAFAATLPAPAEGPLVVRIEAEDERGPRGEAAPCQVVLDTKAPELTVLQPADNALVGPAIEVSGRVVDASACTVVVAGRPASVAPDGAFAGRATLPDGAQEVLVVATDAMGRPSEQRVRLRVDAASPTIALAGELPTLTNQKELRLRGRLTDANVCTLTVDGAAAPVQPGGTFDVPFVFTASRDHAIALVAKDVVGNLSAPTVVRVRYDGEPPVLTLDEPKDGPLLAGDVAVAGTVRDASDWVVRVNGASATRQGERWRAVVQLPAGVDFPLRIEAADAAGNAAVPLQRVLRGEPPLTVPAWADPAPDAQRVTIGALVHPSRVVDKATGLRMVLVPAGEFTMGSPTDEPERGADENAHRRTIGKPFWLGETEVTQAQWQKVMGNNPSKQREADHPVDSVSWDDCQAFVQKLAAAAGPGYRLPSEAEWEHACRAGSTTPFCWGTALDAAQANFDGSRPYPGSRKSDNRRAVLPAGSLPANAFGLREMHGNVYEWCEDTYAPYPGTGTEEPTRGDGKRVVRGGAWASMASGCRSAFRFGSYDPWTRNERVGLRLAHSFDAP